MTVRKALARCAIRLARWLDPSGNYLDSLRDYYDNTSLHEEVKDAVLVNPAPTFNVHPAYVEDWARDMARLQNQAAMRYTGRP